MGRISEKTQEDGIIALKGFCMISRRVLQKLLTGRQGALERPSEKWETKNWPRLIGQVFILQCSPVYLGHFLSTHPYRGNLSLNNSTQIKYIWQMVS